MRKSIAPVWQNNAVVCAFAAIFLLALLIQQSDSNRLALLVIIGTLLGIVLYHSVFGFTSTFPGAAGGWLQRRFQGPDNHARRSVSAVFPVNLAVIAMVST